MHCLNPDCGFEGRRTFDIHLDLALNFPKPDSQTNKKQVQSPSKTEKEERKNELKQEEEEEEKKEEVAKNEESEFPFRVIENEKLDDDVPYLDKDFDVLDEPINKKHTYKYKVRKRLES